jgi:hypothetical protein
MQIDSPKVIKAPVALIIFNRPEATKQVIEVLRKVKIEKLFVIADGPRSDVSDDLDLCNKTRLVIDEIDWPCEVHRRFLKEDIGCGHGPAKGLDWVFERVDRCLILEDDCIPDVSFFPYCNELLEKYADDDRVMMISGNNHTLDKTTIFDSYCFSINTQTHGWATWSRAWNKFDFYIQDWPKLRSLKWLTHYLGNRRYANGWLTTFDEVFEEAKSNPRCSYWDFQWTFACWKNSALNIIPSVNLVTNVGYGNDATHPTPIDHPLARLPADEMQFPLMHPTGIIRNYDVDIALRETVFGHRMLYQKVLRKLIRVSRKFFLPFDQKSK